MKMLQLVFGFAIALGTVANLWAIPAGFNLQGRLTDANGVNRDGTFLIKFSIFANETGGASIWEVTKDVKVQNGNFQIVLAGPRDEGSHETIENQVQGLNAAYVEIRVGSEQQLAPRQQLLRSPFSALSVASEADVLVQSDSNATGTGRIAIRTGNNDRVTILNNGNVGIGANNPDKKLVVAGDASITGNLSAGNLVGAVMFFAGAACPGGWLLADGSLKPKSSYPELASYLGNIYGETATDFGLPNMTDGSFIRGTGGNAANIGVKQTDIIRYHTHTEGNFVNYNDPGVAKGSNGYTRGVASTQQTLDMSPAGGAETRPLNYAMTPCVKY